MRKVVSLMFPVIAAAALIVAAASPGLAAPEPPGPGGVSDAALLTVVGTVGDDVFATTDVASLIDPTGASTQHYGPYASMSPDSGTCGNDWATDTFDRHFTVRTNSDGGFTVVEQFKDGSFVTPAADSVHPNFSPGGCPGQPPSPPQGVVADGVTGSMHGYFIVQLPAGTVQTSNSPYCNAAAMTNANCDTTTFIDTHFTPCYQTGACSANTFFFHYTAPSQSLLENEWRNASADRGGNSGDIRSANI